MRRPVETSVGIEATDLVTGDRQQAYGDPLVNYDRLATILSAMLGIKVSRRQAIHIMILLKLVRDWEHPKRDNEVDICGYATILQMDREERIVMQGEEL